MVKPSLNWQYCPACYAVFKTWHRCKAADSQGEAHVSSDTIATPSMSSNKKNAASSNVVSSNRNARWRAKHPEQWRAIMRDYMRKRRSIGSQGAPA